MREDIQVLEGCELSCLPHDSGEGKPCKRMSFRGGILRKLTLPSGAEVPLTGGLCSRYSETERCCPCKIFLAFNLFPEINKKYRELLFRSYVARKELAYTNEHMSFP